MCSIRTLLLSSDGCSEIDRYTWIRPATQDEIDSALASKGFEFSDEDGICYNWRTILDHAPEGLKQEAENTLRKTRMECWFFTRKS